MNKNLLKLIIYGICEAISAFLLVLMFIWYNDGTLLHSKIWFVVDAIILNVVFISKFIKYKRICFPQQPVKFNNNRLR